MDIFSHGLWGGIALGRKKRSDFIFAVAFSVLPDFFGEGIMFLLVILGINNMPSLKYGHPNISDFPKYAQNFYNTTHSVIIFLSVFALVWMVREKAFLPLGAWGMHIFFDILTHSFKLFPTPFLWPLSNFKIDGIKWDSSLIMIPNFALLILLYSFWFYKKRLKKNLGE